jgi:hypothetical protein
VNTANWFAAFTGAGTKSLERENPLASPFVNTSFDTSARFVKHYDFRA